MTFFEKLENQVFSKQTFLCVGLDPVWEKMPQHLPRTQQGLLEFLLNIVKQTKDYAAAYKPNFAYFEALGISGLEVLQELIKEITPEVSVIGDAKRGDVGHSAQMYARAVFESFGCDAVTVVGATFPEKIKAIREITGQMPFLIPGVGTQGGDLEKTLLYADDGSKLPYLINASRSVIYASPREDFAKQAGIAAKQLRDRINSLRSSL